MVGKHDHSFLFMTIIIRTGHSLETRVFSGRLDCNVAFREILVQSPLSN